MPEGEVRHNEKCACSTSSSELLGSLLGSLCVNSLIFQPDLGHPTDLSVSACCIGQGNKEEPPLSKFSCFFLCPLSFKKKALKEPNQKKDTQLQTALLQYCKNSGRIPGQIFELLLKYSFMLKKD